PRLEISRNHLTDRCVVDTAFEELYYCALAEVRAVDDQHHARVIILQRFNAHVRYPRADDINRAVFRAHPFRAVWIDHLELDRARFGQQTIEIIGQRHYHSSAVLEANVPAFNRKVQIRSISNKHARARPEVISANIDCNSRGAGVQFTRSKPSDLRTAHAK